MGSSLTFIVYRHITLQKILERSQSSSAAQFNALQAQVNFLRASSLGSSMHRIPGSVKGEAHEGVGEEGEG